MSTNPLAGVVVHVVPHVHWDREWYRSFADFRARLVMMVELLLDQLDDGRMPSFHLDGQTSTVADVLEVRPDLETRLAEHIREGRLSIGPWHALSDNQLATAETLVRNLLIGRRWCRRMGAQPRVGYSPDAFGHPPDLPRLLQGFGFDCALVWRGAPADTPRFRWRSPDGSEVFTVNQGYYAADVLWPGPELDSRAANFVAAQQARDPEGPYLLLDGADHVFPSDVRSRLAALAPGHEFRVSRLHEYVDAVHSRPGEIPEVVGELRRTGGKGTFLLPGTLSTRPWLKQVNVEAQLRLERFIEPSLAEHHTSTDLALLDDAWQKLVLNSAHDSICGCSIDEVHDENEVRARAALRLADRLEAVVLRRTGRDPRAHGEPPKSWVDVTTTSGQGQPFSGPVEVDVLTHPDAQVVRLLDPDGHEVPVEATDLGVESHFEADLDLMPDTVVVRRHRLAFVARDVPAFSRKEFRVELGAAPRCAPIRTGCERRVSANGRTVTLLDDGSVEVLDETTGEQWRGLGHLVDVGDRGDSYTFDPIPSDRPLTAVVLTVAAVHSAARTVLQASLRLVLPEASADGRNARSAATVDLDIDLKVTIWHGHPGLHWTLGGVNTARDHRLRWQVPVSADVWSAGEHWSVVERPFRPDVGDLPAGANLEAEVSAAPTHSLAYTGGERPLAILTRGMPEVAGTCTNDRNTLDVTVVRATGWMSRGDLRTRTASAGPEVPTPASQMLRDFKADVAVLLGDECVPEDPLDLHRLALQHEIGFRAVATHESDGYTQPPDAGGDTALVPSVTGALVGAWKPAEDGVGAVLRLVNPLSVSRKVYVDLGPGRTGQWCRLDEVPAPDSNSNGDINQSVSLVMPAHEVRTLRVLPSA